MRDLTDKPFGVNIAQAFVRDPKIYGDFVVWEQGTSASSQVVVYNITTKQQESIACGTDSLPP